MEQELNALKILAEDRLPELKKEMAETEKRFNELTSKLNSGDTTETIWKSRKEGIQETKDMTAEYAQEVIELSDKLKEQKDEYSKLEGVIKQYDDAMILQNGTLEEARKQLGMLDDVQLQNLKTVKELTEADKENYITRLTNDKNFTEEMLRNTKSRIWAMQWEMKAMMSFTGGKAGDISAISRMYTDSEISSADMMDRASMLAHNEAVEANRELIKLEGNLRDIDKALNNISNIKVSNSSSGTNSSSSSKDSKSKKSSKYENKALEEALKLLEHRKKLSEETQDTIKAEIAELNRINNLYVKTDEERMNMAERIYSAEKRLRDRMFSDSSKWINDKKALNELSAEEEIAAWERVKNNQSNNIEAVKQATLNLYKLRNQVMTDSFSREENSIKHLTKLGILSIDEQIKKYRELYEVKASTLSEEQSRVENLFDLYKKQISDQQRTIKETHDNRIEQIEEEAKKKKAMHEEEIKAIEKELELLNRQEDEYDHDKKMADLKEQLAYWQVRTSEDARKKVAELLKQIDEAEHKREVELKKQSLEDKKKVLQDEVKSVEDTAREEREKLEKSYKQIEIAFDEHSINLIALASTMSQGMFEEFQKNYLIPLENALRDGNYDSIGSIVDGINGYGRGLSGYADKYSDTESRYHDSGYSRHDWKTDKYPNGMSDIDYLKFISNGDKWEELRKQGSSANETEMYRLNAENNRLREKYGRNPDLGEYPKFHTGGWAYSEGLAVLQKDELVFPPDLSLGISKLFPLLSNLAKSNIGTESSSLTDNRKQIKIEKLLNIEKNYMEDDIDSEILVRQLQRSITSL